MKQTKFSIDYSSESIDKINTNNIWFQLCKRLLLRNGELVSEIDNYIQIESVFSNMCNFFEIHNRTKFIKKLWFDISFTEGCYIFEIEWLWFSFSSRNSSYYPPKKSKDNWKNCDYLTPFPLI
jgi:hypothetical protein